MASPGGRMHPTIAIREADDSDVDVLVALAGIVQELHVTAIPEFFKRIDPEAVAEWFRGMLARADVKVWLATSNDVAVGYAVAVVTTRPETPFSVARSFYQLDLVKPASARIVELTSWSFNEAAHSAFAALGFQPMVVRFGRRCD